MNDIDFISNLLSYFGLIPKKLVFAILNKPNPQITEHLLRRIRSLGRAWVTDEYVAANRFCKPNERVISALWVATDFMKKNEVHGLRSCTLPSVLTFIQNKQVYEVIVINDGEDYMLAGVDPNPQTKYILVVSDPEERKRLRYLQNFSGVKYIFATVREVSVNEEPEICYYRGDDNAEL